MGSETTIPLMLSLMGRKILGFGSGFNLRLEVVMM
jgi:hypothetical protein